MIPIDDFIQLIHAAIPRFGASPPDPEQERCILFDSSTPLMIAAGPGTGKTSTLALRALRLVFVDRLLPEEIVITTFTKKAAAEIRARLIEWGLLLKNHLLRTPPTPTPPTPTPPTPTPPTPTPPTPTPPNFSTWLNGIDVNRFITGTLDSICEEALTRSRHPSDPAPVLVEGFVANAELMFNALLPCGANNNNDLNRYLSPFTFDGSLPTNFGEVLQISRTLIDRLTHDDVDVALYRTDPNHTNAKDCIAESATVYNAYMASTNKMDFAQLELQFFNRLSTNRLARFTNGIRAILIDEYQDTNPLQENIYFELARQTSASITIVGDDDQSLYRFRGATVELFRDFVARFSSNVPGYSSPHLEYLVRNYRSSPEIVAFFNDFLQRDQSFLPARVQPPKPLINPQRSSNNIPLLGMFRDNASDLADDLVDFLFDMFRGNGRQIPFNGQPHTIIRNPNGGDFGDCVFLSHTVDEYARAWGSNSPRQRLPGLVRERLEARNISVFNPRGRALRDTQVVQQLLGCILECIDPNRVQESIIIANNQLRNEARINLDTWRQAAQAFIASNPTPNTPHTISDFVTAWQSLTPPPQMQAWPKEWPLLELCFKLITWLPFLQSDPEGQTYLEAISRCISQAATFSSYRSSIVFDGGINHERSVRRAILDIFAPIAEKSVVVDEEIMPHVPRNWLPIMTIHQAKGLEYPLVIVDISSDYKTNHPRQRFRRFPEQPSSVQNMEDDLAPHCDIGSARLTRGASERTFDDLKRLYYVAYSRPQSALLLVGLTSCLRYNTTIKHIATGWTSDNTWPWRQPVTTGAPPSLVNAHPLELI